MAIKRLAARERVESFLRAQHGEIEIPRGLAPAALRVALIEAGCIVPGGYHEMRDAFETDDRGRFEAACAIFFDCDSARVEGGRYSDEERRAIVVAVIDNPAVDSGVTYYLRAMLNMDDARRQTIRDAFHDRRRAWRQLFPHAHEVPNDLRPIQRAAYEEAISRGAR